MKALLCTAFGPIDSLRIEDVAIPEPGAGQVRVQVKAASLNFPDALIVQGLYQVKPSLPFSPGAEFAGVIDAVGEGVTAWRPGDSVVAFTGHGGFAQQCVADVHQIAALPPGMTFEQGAALVLAYGTSLHALQQRARLQEGETLLVLGAAGGVGLAAIEIAKALGARVIAAASSADKLALCRDAGADETIDYATEDLRRRVDELTGGRGADVVYDPGGGAYSEAALRATAWRGRFLVVGFAAETERVIEHAREKREKKGCDWILANDVGPGTGTFGGEMNSIHLVEAGAVESWPRMTKAQVAEKLADRIAEHLGEAE